MVSLDKPWKRYQAPALKFDCPFYFLQAFEVPECLIPNPIVFDTSIMNVNSLNYIFTVVMSPEMCYFLQDDVS